MMDLNSLSARSSGREVISGHHDPPLAVPPMGITGLFTKQRL